MHILKLLALVLTFSYNTALSRDFIIVQSTTSTANTGLLDILSQNFYTETGIEVRTVAVGSGTAIANAQRGDGDVLLVHSKVDELEFVQKGFGVERFDLMYNDFVVIGPKFDPANIRNKKNISDVMKVLSKSTFKFISRDDNSGTHKKELLLWKNAKSPVPTDSSYIKTGSGMANTINIASEMKAYALTDRGTWISFINKKNLEILFENDQSLHNSYGVIAVNPEIFPHVEYKKSQIFIDWLLKGQGKEIINNYIVEGQQLFFTYN